MLNWSCLRVDCIETILLWCCIRLRVWNYESHYKICYRKLKRRGVLPWSCWPRPANSPSRSNARWPPCLGRWWPMLQVRTTAHVLQESSYPACKTDQKAREGGVHRLWISVKYCSFTVILPPCLTAQPIHWIYDDSVLTKVLAGASNPEFITPSANPYYRLPTGSQSPYGDQLLVMLESLMACKGGGTLKPSSDICPCGPFV